MTFTKFEMHLLLAAVDVMLEHGEEVYKRSYMDSFEYEVFVTLKVIRSKLLDLIEDGCKQ